MAMARNLKITSISEKFNAALIFNYTILCVVEKLVSRSKHRWDDI